MKQTDICAVHRALEGQQVQPTDLPYPQAQAAGDFAAGKLLRNAACALVRGRSAALVVSLFGHAPTRYKLLHR